MPRITKVYTRQGDRGTTRLGGGQKVSKDAARIEAYGTVDELNSCIGAVLAFGVNERVAKPLREIQNQLFDLGADLCMLEEDKSERAVPTIGDAHVRDLEKLMDELTAELGPLENFILPGGSRGAALLHVARTVCRRAERCVVHLAREENVSPQALAYLNRLSDALFVMARYENLRRGVEDVLWQPGRRPGGKAGQD